MAYQSGLAFRCCLGVKGWSFRPFGGREYPVHRSLLEQRKQTFEKGLASAFNVSV